MAPARHAGLDGAPGLARRHAVLVARPRLLVPARARIVVLVIHRGEGLQPRGFRLVDQVLALLAPRIACLRPELRQKLLRDLLGVAADADRHLLGEADAVGVDVDLDNLGVLGPVIDAVARQGRERVEAGAERQHHVGLGDELHGRLGAVIAERPDSERVAAREGVVVLVAGADRGIEAFGEGRGIGDRVTDHHASAVEDHGELGVRQELGRLGDRPPCRRRGAPAARSGAARCRRHGSRSRAER